MKKATWEQEKNLINYPQKLEEFNASLYNYYKNMLHTDNQKKLEFRIYQKKIKIFVSIYLHIFNYIFV